MPESAEVISVERARGSPVGDPAPRATAAEYQAGPRPLVAPDDLRGERWRGLTWVRIASSVPGSASRLFDRNQARWKRCVPRMAKQEELPIIQKTYDLILWYVPIINRLPRDHKFTLGDRIATGLYDLLDELIVARYESRKLARLEAINTRLDLLRFQTRLLRDFKLIEPQRYAHASKLINEVGVDLGSWIKQQKANTN